MSSFARIFNFILSILLYLLAVFFYYKIFKIIKNKYKTSKSQIPPKKILSKVKLFLIIFLKKNLKI